MKKINKFKVSIIIISAAAIISGCTASVPKEKINLVKSNFSLANDKYAKIAKSINESNDKKLKENYIKWGKALAHYSGEITSEIDKMQEGEVDVLDMGVNKLLTALEEAEKELKNDEETAEYGESAAASANGNSNVNLNFTLINSLNVDIREIYISESQGKNWKTNLISDIKALSVGERIDISFSAGQSENLWDIKAVDGSGTAVYFIGIDLLNSSEVTLTIDEDNKTVAKSK